MFVPTETSAYAIRALVCLARQPERWMRADAIAASADVPRPYLARVLHTQPSGSGDLACQVFCAYRGKTRPAGTRPGILLRVLG
jgi:hypothetical protein